jgi:zinc-ribbon domain
MFCPNCGRDNSGTKKFCPSCGLKLQTIAEVLTNEQAPLVQPIISKPKSRQQAMLPGLFLILTGIIISLMGADGFANKAITDIGVIVAIIGMGLIAYKGLGQGNSKSKSLQNSPAISPAATVRLLPAMPTEEPISITEHTTRELDLAFVDSGKLSK